MKEIFTLRRTKFQRNLQILMIFMVVIAMLLVDGFFSLSYTTRALYKVGLFVIVPLFLAGFIPWFDLFSVFRVKKDQKALLHALFLGMGVYVFLILLYIFLKDILDLNQIKGALESSVAVNKKNFLAVAIYISFINAFLEEFFFRGFAYLKLIDKMPKFFASTISALAFSLYHIGMVTGWVSPLLTILGLLGLFVAGMLFNYINNRQGNIYASYAVHMFANFALNTIGLQMFGLINLPFLQ